MILILKLQNKFAVDVITGEGELPEIFGDLEGLILSGSDDFYVSAVIGKRALISEVFEAVVEDFGAVDGFFGPIFGWFGDLPGSQDGVGSEHEVPV